ncbi:MAG: putative 2-aminoethylphosphonate ABC transporter permease subunit, partial [Alphaproteobacteria bacterium]
MPDMASDISSVPEVAMDDVPLAKPVLSRDDWVMRAFMGVIALYLIIALALPLYAMLSKSFSTFRFDLNTYEFQVDAGTGAGWQPAQTGLALNQALLATAPDKAIPALDLATSSDGRLSAPRLFPNFSFRGPEVYRLRALTPDTVFLFGSERIADTQWHEFSSNDFRRVTLRPVKDIGITNYLTYFSTPTLFRSIENSLIIALISTLITVTLAFGFAYAINRSCMALKGVFRLVAIAPILVPSLLPGIALVYLFGNQ